MAFTVRKQNIYKVLSIAGLVSVLFAFANGLRFAASNFTVDQISMKMATGFILGFILYFVMAMLMYREMAIHVEKF